MDRGQWWWVLVLLVVGGSRIGLGAEPDPEEVRRRMEVYMRDFPSEVAEPAPAPAVDHDREAWQSAEKCGTTACFEAYLADYPKGRYARMARARLTSKSETPPAAAERPRSPSRPVQALLADRYRDHGDGTVTDVKTGLQWMRCSLGQTWRDGTCPGEVKGYQWQPALDAAKALNRQGGYAGYRDWRVPKREELRTLVYCSSGQPKTWNDTGDRCEGDYQTPTIDLSAFPNTPARWFWSASPYDPYVGFAWSVSFSSGNVVADFRGGNDAVRLVRGGP